jgi:2-keto-4-pentenoate hydratase/2-oxohepta-3-ene-1,7-dioic acid hydratase in catechol pathway
LKIVVFGADERVGAIDGEEIVDLNATDASIPRDLAAFIAAGPAALDAAKRAIRANGVRHATRAAKLHAPWAHKRIACAGGNYAAHAYGMAVNMLGIKGATPESVAKRVRDDGLWGFWKDLDEVAGPGDTIPFPQRATFFDYEGEVAIVIGKRGKNIPADRIADYIWGVTLAIDWSIRDADSAPQRPVNFNLMKNFDRSASVGPCIVVGEFDPQRLDVETRVDGELRQTYNSKDMVFSFGELLAHLSRDFTFVPGDVILGGTGAGTAQDTTKTEADGSRPLDRFLHRGQVVEVSSPSIGALTATIL